MKSMTGYGRATVVAKDFSVAVDLKTVNHRFLDIHLRMSAELASLEPAIKRRIGSRLSRGRVDANVNLERTTSVAYELNRPLIAGYLEALRTVQTEFGVSGELDINSLARLPGALQTAKEGLSDEVIAGVQRAVDDGLATGASMKAAVAGTA